jgi:hypothetical protein
MGGERRRHARPTSELDRKEIARLAAETRTASEPDEFDESSFAELAENLPTFELSVVARAKTLHDPLTTSLLAEVARRSQTVELDEAEIFVLDEDSIQPIQVAANRRR